jgi:hypothetical protein
MFPLRKLQRFFFHIHLFEESLKDGYAEKMSTPHYPKSIMAFT